MTVAQASAQAAATSGESAPAVRTRQVFFISGFDPKGAAYYHRLHAQGAQAQSQTAGYVCTVGKRQRTDDPAVQAWKVDWTNGAARERHDPAEVATTVHFLAWDDLVRAQWPKSALAVAWGALLAYGAVLSTGRGLVKVRRQSPRTLVALAYPAALWILALALGVGAGLLAVWLARVVAGFIPSGTFAAPALVDGLAFGATCLGVWWGALRLEQRLHTSWLLRIYRFADLWAGGRLPALEKRIDQMAQRVFDALCKERADEVLVVGYSVGSMLGVSVLARVLGKCAALPRPERARVLGRLSFMTLGHCVPLLGLLPKARRFRAELSALASTPALRWVDYSSPTDWGSFALVDPLPMCLDPNPPALKPRMLSPRFHTLFEPAAYAEMKKNKRRMHLQYLMPSPKAGGYDYFFITAGPQRLGDIVD